MNALLSAFLVALTPPASAAGLHRGENKTFDVAVEFLAPAGQTTTDASGITYRSGSWSHSEPKVYARDLWGTYPLYFVGQMMRFRVTLRNKSARGSKKLKVRIEALNRVLETGGTLGAPIGQTFAWEIDDLRPGQETAKEFSVFIDPRADLPSGLDATKVRILHLNGGANADAGLIREELAVWCPPALKDAP